MKKAFIIMTFSAMAAGCADNSIPKAQLPELDLSNPLLAAWDTPHETPPFSEIKLADYEPAFDAAIACSRAEIDAIVNNPKKPTFGNTIVALERQGELLNRIAGLFFNLLEADTSDEMQQIAQRVQPKLTELSNDISLNPELFARVKQVYEHPGRLRKEDRKLLEDTYQSFARSGAALSEADKELFRKYTSELSGLTLRFGQNALAATNAFTLNITDPKVVAELPAFVREGMAAEAKARGEKGWTVTLQHPSYLPFMTYSSNRELKEKLWKASNSRALGGEFDNTRIDEPPDVFGIKRSLSRKGNPYDNAVVESTNRLLKKELVYRNSYATIEQLRHDLNDYVWWSDNQRLHSTLGYRSPKEFTEQGLVL